jgi:glycosyltransferase involved in cell wall biosynthesis
MKIVAFAGETFSSYQNKQYTKPTSIAFLQDAFGVENVVAASPSIKVSNQPESYSTVVSAEQFYTFPHYSSTKQFFISCLTKKGYYKNYINIADRVIQENKGKYFWIRTPSVGSIVFGLRALKLDQKVLHHMCADASNTWRDTKYKGVSKLVAFITSRFIRILLKRICSNKNTINFCTGDVLENFSRKYSNNTYQFVDVMVKKITSESFCNHNKSDSLNLLFVGRMVEDKGVFDLIEVINNLKENISLTFVGDGPDLEKAIDLVELYSLGSKIKFTGQLPHSSLGHVFADADIVTVPSNNNYEGFPRVIMEAWSYHKPVIVSDVGGINAFVKHRVNGLIVTPGCKKELTEAINIIIKDKMLLKDLTIGAKKMVEQSSQKYWVENIKSIINSYCKISKL